MAFDFSFLGLPEVEQGSFFSPASVGAKRVSNSFEPPAEPKNKWLALMESIKPQPTPGLDKYRDLVSHTPQMEQYQPSKWRRFGAALAGGLAGAGSRNPGAGYELGRTIIEQPYQNALKNFSVQEQGLRQAATREVEDTKAQNTYLKNIFEAYTKEMETAGKTQRVGMQQSGATERTGMTTATQESMNARDNATKKALENIKALTAVTVAQEATTRSAATNASNERRTSTTAAASRYGSDKRLEGQEYSADRTVDAAAARGSSTGEKELAAAQMNSLRQQFIVSSMQKYSKLFSQDGPVQPRIGTGGNPTGEFILASPDSVDDDMKGDYFQFANELSDFLESARDRMNASRGVRVNPPSQSQGLPTIPQVRPVGPPSQSNKFESEVRLPGGRIIRKRKVK